MALRIFTPLAQTYEGRVKMLKKIIIAAALIEGIGFAALFAA